MESSYTTAVKWLGQAGFALSHRGQLLFIDPYLSDHLAQKYKGTDKPHDRLMPSPILPETVRGLGWVLCTHRHSDHMDPGALPVLARNNPLCKFVVPRAERESALQIGVPEAQLLEVNAGETVELSDQIRLTVIPSAHEELKTNGKGEHHFLGYILRLGNCAVYHPGDCVPYEGLEARLRKERIDWALLPVNGRGRGVPGNFTFEQAVELCLAAGIPRMIPHHFGMFAFNTVEESELGLKTAMTAVPECVMPRCNVWMELTGPVRR